jgi:thioredoxin 1
MSEVIFTDGNFEQEAINSEIPVMVDFFAPWCGPCKMMAPAVEKLAEEMKGKIKIGKLNVDENPETSLKYDIRSIPTIIFFKNGEAVSQLVGFQSEEALKEKMGSLTSVA